jgi:hypothetical protein
VKTHFHRQDGNRPWGVFQEHRIEFKDGIYDLALLNQAVNETLTAKGFGSETLRFLVVGIRVRLSLMVGAAVPVRDTLLQVDFASSTIAELLGFDKIAQPPDYRDSYFFEHVAESSSSLLPGYTATASANSTGEWILNVATGLEHTLVQTCAGGERVPGVLCSKTRLWALGSNQYGQLGTEQNFLSRASNSVPLLILARGSFDPNDAKSIHAGGSHSAVVDASGNIWTFGSNTYGQCGDYSIHQPPFDFDWHPRKINTQAAFLTDKLDDVTLALGQDHTLVTGTVVTGTDQKRTRFLWAFGRNQFGQLGLHLHFVCRRKSQCV